ALLAQQLHDDGMVVVESMDANTRQQIKIALVGAVDKICTGAALDQDVIAGVCPEDVLAFQFFYVRELHRLKSLAYARQFGMEAEGKTGSAGVVGTQTMSPSDPGFPRFSMKILTAAQIREIDRLSSEKYGIPRTLLMENAGMRVVEALQDEFENLE